MRTGTDEPRQIVGAALPDGPATISGLATMSIVLCVRSTVPDAATLSSGLVIWRLLVWAMPLVMVKAAAEVVEGRLGARALTQIGISTRAELADHLGDVDALDRTVADGEAALAFSEDFISSAFVPAAAIWSVSLVWPSSMLNCAASDSSVLACTPSSWNRR